MTGFSTPMACERQELTACARFSSSANFGICQYSVELATGCRHRAFTQLIRSDFRRRFGQVLFLKSEVTARISAVAGWNAPHCALHRARRRTHGPEQAIRGSWQVREPVRRRADPGGRE